MSSPISGQEGARHPATKSTQPLPGMLQVLQTRTTYATRSNAIAALNKAIQRSGGDPTRCRYVIAVNEEGRFAPVVFGSEWLILAMYYSITVVST